MFLEDLILSGGADCCHRQPLCLCRSVQGTFLPSGWEAGLPRGDSGTQDASILGLIPAPGPTASAQSAVGKRGHVRRMWEFLWARPGIRAFPFYSHSIGRNSITWRLLAARKAGKCSPAVDPARRADGWGNSTSLAKCTSFAGSTYKYWAPLVPSAPGFKPHSSAHPRAENRHRIWISSINAVFLL